MKSNFSASNFQSLHAYLSHVKMPTTLADSIIKICVFCNHGWHFHGNIWFNSARKPPTHYTVHCVFDDVSFFLFFSFQWLLNLSHWIPIHANLMHEIISLLMVSFWHFPKHLYVNCENKWQNRKEQFCITNSPNNNDTKNKVNTL